MPPPRVPRPAPDVVSLGTSQLRNTGSRLNDELMTEGMSSYTVSKSGALISDIGDIASDLFPGFSSQPSSVVIYAGGNDCGKNAYMNTIKDKYEKLVLSIHTMCPDAQIILNYIPPTRHEARTNRRINFLNSYLFYLSEKYDYVLAIRAAPCNTDYYYSRG